MLKSCGINYNQQSMAIVGTDRKKHDIAMIQWICLMLAKYELNINIVNKSKILNFYAMHHLKFIASISKHFFLCNLNPNFNLFMVSNYSKSAPYVTIPLFVRAYNYQGVNARRD